LVSLLPFNLRWGAAMQNDEESFAEKKTGEEEIIDFEFDELSTDAGDVEMTEVDEEEIIELVDVVERGKEPAPPDSETAEIERLLDEEGALEEVEIEEPSGEDLEAESVKEDMSDSDLLEPVEEDEFELLESDETRALSEREAPASLEEETQDLELDLDSALETIGPLEKEVSSQEWEEPVALESEDAEESELEELTPVLEEESTPAEAEIVESTVKLPAEDLSAIPPGDEPADLDMGAEGPGFESMTGISEERLEEIVTRAVKEVVQDSLEAMVERAARETMAEVAERLISEAIESLKESLVATSD
jgi:hypothetical protein